MRLHIATFTVRPAALAAELRERGVRKGDRVAVMLPNCCELAVLYFACIYLGAVIVPVNPALSKSEVRFILASCRPALVVASTSSAESVREFHSNVLRLQTAQEVDGNAPDQIKIEALKKREDFVPLETADAEDLVVIMYTSGTSAKPKGLGAQGGPYVPQRPGIRQRSGNQ